MDGLSIKQNVDSAPTVLAGDFDICLAGCHGDGSALLPDGQVVSIVASQDIPTVAANELVISAISHVNPPRYCSFLSAAYFLEMNFPSIRNSQSDSHKFHPDQATHRSMRTSDTGSLHAPSSSLVKIFRRSIVSRRSVSRLAVVLPFHDLEKIIWFN